MLLVCLLLYKNQVRRDHDQMGSSVFTECVGILLQDLPSDVVGQVTSADFPIFIEPFGLRTHFLPGTLTAVLSLPSIIAGTSKQVVFGCNGVTVLLFRGI